MTKHIHIHLSKTKDAEPRANSAAERANRFVDDCVLRSKQLTKIGASASSQADARNLIAQFKQLIASAEMGIRLAEQAKNEPN